MQKDYSEYVPTEQEQYQLRRQGNEFIDFEYFNNRARFDPERRTLDIQVDGKKESLWMDELIEEYESAREERGGEEFLGRTRTAQRRTGGTTRRTCHGWTSATASATSRMRISSRATSL